MVPSSRRSRRTGFGAHTRRRIDRAVNVQRTFRCCTSEVGEARRFVTTAPADAEVTAESVVDAARWAVSELASNAIEHAETGFEVTVDVIDDVRTTVHDGS